MDYNMTNAVKIFWLSSIKVSQFVISPLITVFIETGQKSSVANIHLLVNFSGLWIKHSKRVGDRGSEKH